jgi:hypothetical protein
MILANGRLRNQIMAGMLRYQVDAVLKVMCGGLKVGIELVDALDDQL